jgi:hypothetical protein
MKQNAGFTQTHFQSNSVNDCWNFVYGRLLSKNKMVSLGAFKLRVEDSLGERIEPPLPGDEDFVRKSA